MEDDNVQGMMADPLAYEVQFLQRLDQSRVERLFRWADSSTTSEGGGRLPWELVLHIFRMLNAPALCAAGVVSKDWQMLADSDALWSRIYVQVFRVEIPLLTIAPFGNSWKRACKEIALLPVIGTRCRAETSSGNFNPGVITKVTQASRLTVIGPYTVQQVVQVGNLFPSIIPALHIVPVPEGKEAVPFNFEELKRRQQKINFTRKAKTRLAIELLSDFDSMDIELDEEEWKHLFEDQQKQKQLLMAARKRLLDSLLDTAQKRARYEEVSPNEDSGLFNTLSARFWRKNDATVQVRVADLLGAEVMVTHSDWGEHSHRLGWVKQLSEGGHLTVELGDISLDTPCESVHLFTENSDAHKRLLRAIVRGDSGVKGMEVFFPSNGNNQTWTLGRICSTSTTSQHRYEDVVTTDAGWTSWCTLEQLTNFASDFDIARSLFWKVVASASLPKVDKSLFGKRMLIQNRSQNLGGRIIQAHTAGTIVSESTPVSSKTVYLYEKNEDLACGNYKIALQYQVKMELNQSISFVGEHQLYYFPTVPPVISIGDRVLAEWRIGYWYVGTITHATPGGWHVSYDDGDQQDDVPEARLMHLATSKYRSPFADEESSATS